MNIVTISGRLVKDPEFASTSSQLPVAKFTLAIDRKMSKEKRKEAEQKGQSTADFIRVVVFKKKAELCNQFLRKGLRAIVKGELRTGSYKTQTGETRYTVEVYASDVEFIDFANKSQSSNVDYVEDDFGGDIPF